MAITTLVTNKPQIPALVIDTDNNTLSFEYGGQLTEFVYHIDNTQLSTHALLGYLTDAVANGVFTPMLQGYIADGAMNADPDNPHEITDPMWLAVAALETAP